MKKTILALSLMATLQATAQPEGRVLTISTQPYTSLPSPTVITQPGWDDFSATVPLGFNFTLFGQSTQTLYFDNDVNLGMDITLSTAAHGPVSLIGTFEDYLDRDTALNGKSYVGYSISGATGSRIAKIEGKNLGFYNEYNGASGTLNDSTNFQIWIYEGSNAVEVHWGPSSIAQNYTDLFSFGAPLFAFIKNLDVNTPNLDFAYYVSNASPTAPKVDSLNFVQFSSLTSPIGMSTYPANGTVFKFAFPTTSVNGVALNNYATVYPTAFINNVTIEITAPDFKGTAALLDMTGKVVAQQELKNGKNSIATTDLASGNYIVNIRNGEESVFYKIVKQ
jgi:hypothetical protein